MKRVDELRKMGIEDLNKKLRELKLELMKELANVKARRPIKNPAKIRLIKKTIARILTIRNEKLRGGK